MYPYLEIFGIKVYTLGIGIVLCIFFFLFWLKHYSYKNNLNFWKFFTRFPLFIILIYFFWSYFYYLIEYFIVLPTSLAEVKMIFSPYWYNFSFIGLSFGFFLSLFIFLRRCPLKSEAKKRIDIIFYSLALTLIPLGFFLLLGDNFIGKPTDSLIWIKTFFENSELIKYDRVYPVGFFVSIAGLFSFLLFFFLHYLFKLNGIWIFGFIILIIFLNFVFNFQQYPKHWVVEFMNIWLDLKNFWSFGLIFTLIFYNFFVLKFK